MKTILVVDDEKIIRENIKEYLKKENYKVIEAADGKEAISLFNCNNIDLIILDLMLPEIMGEDICQTIRKSSAVPIIMLTAKANEENIVNGLNIGADDYLTKPFSLKELVARVNSLIRRSLNEHKSLTVGDLKIDFELYEVYKNNQLCKLTKTEFNILATLAKNNNKVFTREELAEIIFDDFNAYDRVIDSHIKNLRSKIENNSSSPKYILTVRGVGYKFGDTNEI